MFGTWSIYLGFAVAFPNRIMGLVLLKLVVLCLCLSLLLLLCSFMDLPKIHLTKLSYFTNLKSVGLFLGWFPESKPPNHPGKFKYFTNLNLAFIKGNDFQIISLWFPYVFPIKKKKKTMIPRWFQASGERCNFPCLVFEGLKQLLTIQIGTHTSSVLDCVVLNDEWQYGIVCNDF